MAESKRCEPGGPYCVGMDALLDANVKRGAQAKVLMNFKTLEQRTVIMHAALVEGRKRQMVFSFCPCCGAQLDEKENSHG